MNKQLVGSVDLIVDYNNSIAYIKVKKGDQGRNATIRANEKSFITWIRECFGVGYCNVSTFMNSRSYFTHRRVKTTRRFWKGIITETNFRRMRDQPKKSDWYEEKDEHGEPIGKFVNLATTIPSHISKFLRPCLPVNNWHSL